MFRSRVLAGVALTAALVLTGCQGGGAAGNSGSGGEAKVIDPDGTVRYAFVQNPISFDPARSSNAFDQIPLGLAYDQLLWNNEDDELEPMLATEWGFVDGGAALEMTLRDDVTFIDGEKFNAAAVKANLDRARTLPKSLHLGTLARIESIDVVEEYKVRFNLNGPGANLPRLFSSNVGSMVSPAALNNPDLDQKPVGSGMAKLVEYIPSQVHRWEANADYWDPDAIKAAKYEVYIQTSSPTRQNMLTTGQADLTYLLPQDEDAAKAAGLNVAPSASTSIFQLNINADPAKPIGNPKVRKALEHAIDRQSLVKGVFFGAGEPVAQHIPPSNWAYNPNVQPDDPKYGYDPNLAKQLLAEAGYPNGVDLDMMIPGLDDHRALGEALVPMLAESGFRVKSRVQEAATAGIFFSERAGDFMPGLTPPVLDVTNTYQRNLKGYYTNQFNNTSERFTQLWMDSMAGESEADRLPAIHRMIDEEKSLRNGIPLFLFTPPSAWNDKIVFPEGYKPAYKPHFRGVGVTK